MRNMYFTVNSFLMAPIHSKDDNRHVFTVRDMPHYAAYLQFLINIIQIHFEHVKLGAADHRISEAINPSDLEVLSTYLLSLQPGDSVDIKEKDARVLYASFVIVSRLLLTDYGEEIASRLISRLPVQHRWHQFEFFRNDILKHNTQMLLDMDANMNGEIRGLDKVKTSLALVTV